ncbi:hypothetical protein PENSPDRAFT_609309 [Peniophora sp. CONT]|nr:hypothetical protein PENSPDRAFT_609309 [Peniophora sp. CONT]
MALNLEIIPLSASVDMYGPADQASSYSLSGHVAVSLRPTMGLFGTRPAPARMLLKSLALTFEGQSELYTSTTGYSAVRLCTISKNLVTPACPIELCADDFEDGATWNITFDMRLPGWLPPSDIFGDISTAPPGTSYALHCAATAIALEDRNAAPSWMSLCTPSFLRTRVVGSAPCPVIVNRYSMAASSSALMTNYIVKANLPDGPIGVPRDVLDKLEIVISAPEYITLDQEDFPFFVRMRAPGLSDADAARLRLDSVMVTKLEQIEKYRTDLGTWGDRYPLPPSSRQPPNFDLRQPHPMHSMYDAGLCSGRPNFTLCDTFSLLPEAKMVRYKLDRSAVDIPHGDIPPRTGDASGDAVAWYAVQTAIPVARVSAESIPWAGARTLRPDTAGPWLSVRHQMTINICVGWTEEDGADACTERLAFTLPLEIIRTRPAIVAPVEPVRDIAPQTTSISMPPMLAYDLPVYNQLYHSNGDRKVDHSEQLPLYTAFDPQQSHAEDGAAPVRKPSMVDGLSVAPSSAA